MYKYSSYLLKIEFKMNKTKDFVSLHFSNRPITYCHPVYLYYTRIYVN